MTEQNGSQIITTDPEAQYQMTAHPQMSSALAAVESSKAVAEIQASLVIAKANPRDESRSEHQIMNSCKRVSLAKSATYLFRRGGTNVTGPSIRLVEVIARSWGNIKFGFKELERGKDYSEVEAFAHDLQTNTHIVRQFRVKHVRDKRSGAEAITAERDKYEHVASMAQRRVRACILGVIPADIVEMAVDACDATLNGSIGDIQEAIKGILAAFETLEVTKKEIEGYLQRKIESIVPADVINLRKIHTSIKNGIAPKEEFFRPEDVGNLNKRFGSNGKKQSKKTDKKTPPRSTKTTGGGSRKNPTGSSGNGIDGDGGVGDNESPGQSGSVEQHGGTLPPSPEDIGEDNGRVPDELKHSPDGEIACPQAGGMMVNASDCEGQSCRPGCPEWE